MKVTIIGTGNMGKGLAQELVKAGHQLNIGSREPEKAIALAEQLGRGTRGGSIAESVTHADLVILAVPYGALANTIQDAGNLQDKTLIDISNPISADYKELVIGHSTSAAEEIQKLAPNALVVKAFNTIFAPLLSTEGRNGKTLQTFIASDDANAKATVSELVKSIGFEAIDSGALANSRYLEPVGEMNIHFGFFLGHGPVVAPAWVKV